jgi:hypothetical protein
MAGVEAHANLGRTVAQEATGKKADLEDNIGWLGRNIGSRLHDAIGQCFPIFAP